MFEKSIMNLIFVATALFIIFLGWRVYYEATFDYTVCDTTEQYRDQHSYAYTTYMKVGEVQVPTFHPARDWTERLYSCPKGKKGQRFDKWRTENRPSG